jgi:hypothetical protein
MVGERNFTTCRILLLGWIITSCGFGLLMLMDKDKSVAGDILLNIPSGIGIGILLPASNICAQKITSTKGGQAQTLLLSLRYLGSTLGLVVVGIIFREILHHNLMSTKFESMASEMTKHATTLVYSIRKFADPHDVDILTSAIQDTLRTTWMVLAFTCLAMVLMTALAAATGPRASRTRVTKC